jgi:hypothetical protein
MHFNKAESETAGKREEVPLAGFSDLDFCAAI